jgi:DNA-binding GntR family transcriptional regulator
VPELTGEPAYRQVANDLRRQITTGALPTGAQLPSTTALTRKYGVSATVIKAALNELRVDGLVVGQQGKGTFVRNPSNATSGSDSELREIMAHIQALRDDLRQVNERLASLEEQIQERQDKS